MPETSGLPADIAEFIEWIAGYVSSYGHLKWNEEAKIKADMMNVRARWAKDRVTAAAVREKCVATGFPADDADRVADWVTKIQAGRRLVPNKAYRSFQFPASPQGEKLTSDLDIGPEAIST